jgi:hypothetical protein
LLLDIQAFLAAVQEKVIGAINSVGAQLQQMNQTLATSNAAAQAAFASAEAKVNDAKAKVLLAQAAFDSAYSKVCKSSDVQPAPQQVVGAPACTCLRQFGRLPSTRLAW